MRRIKSIDETNVPKEITGENKPEVSKEKKISRLDTKEPPKVLLDRISLAYLNSQDIKYSYTEMEVKFGTRGFKPLTKIDYDNVVKKLISNGWTTINPEGLYLLRIQPEFLDVRTGQYKTSGDFDRFRIEIDGFTHVQNYCKTNSINFVNDKNSHVLKINRKTPVKVSKDKDEIIPSANFDDFNFRVSINNEETISKTGKIGQDVFENWNKTKKVFRYLNRVTFVHKDHPFKIDISIVKSSTKNDRGWMIQTYNIEESNVFNNPESYEIEIEVEKSAKQTYRSPTDLSNALQKIVTQVLSGLQKTNFPISYPEQRTVLQNYHKLLFEEEYKKKDGEYIPKKNVYSSDFIGPGLVTLDIINIAPLNPDVIVPNITEPYSYCVTEKADGDRHLLYVNNVGRIYLINTNMNVIFTGAKTEEEKCYNSLLDGELILHNKSKSFINTFAAFDIYYINNVDVRARPFINTHSKDERYFKDGCRLPILKQFIKALNPLSIVSKKSEEFTGLKSLMEKSKGINISPIKIISKNFYPNFDSDLEGVSSTKIKYNIFEASNMLLRRIADEDFEYEIDGLIFTPTLLGVGGSKILEAGPKKKITWPYIFKWKPSSATEIFPKSYNTIDFLVVTKKGTDGRDMVTPIFENGINNYESTQYNQYKTLILTVGYDPTRHGYINPCQDLLDDKYSNIKDIDNEEGYKPKQFFPSDPFDPLAGLCNVMLEMDSNSTYQMFTEEREVFDDQMVVEFRYDQTKPGMWKWIPMRVRYDKTAEFRAGNGVGANDYKTANSNWHSIHNPVTEKMIATGDGIPGMEVSDDVYYNSVTSDKMTQRMRDFHNLYVKKALIQGVSRKGNILIDFACGKAGDLPKWIGAELSFVFGIDISSDNIENRLNGACARYLNFKMTNKNMPYALFVNGNSSKNIRSGINMFNDKANQITKSVFGSIGIDKSLGPAVERQHSKGHNGFDVSSCQFALHYMFENKVTFYNFIRNVAECTKLYGYFIATCYDGRTIFNLLKKKEQGESKEIYVDDKKVWSITKQYDGSTFEDNEGCLGYQIDVYQDSINQTLPEYLVNFDFLTSTMDKYGFTLITRDEARQMKLPEGSGMFSELFNSMENEVKRHPEKENDYKDALKMRDYEKDISFLNRFFIYKKTSTRNAEKLTRTLLDQLPDEEALELAGTMLAREEVKKAEEIIKPKAKRLSGKLKLQEATEALEEAKPSVKKGKTRKMKDVEENVETEVIEGEDIIEIAPITKKKGTRKKKEVEFDIVDDK